jgi:hypothetical protein
LDVDVDLSADVNAEDIGISWASHGGHLTVVERRLEAGADTQADIWVLRFTSEQGHAAAVERLPAAGASVHADDDDALRGM